MGTFWPNLVVADLIRYRMDSEPDFNWIPNQNQNPHPRNRKSGTPKLCTPSTQQLVHSHGEMKQVHGFERPEALSMVPEADESTLGAPASHGRFKINLDALHRCRWAKKRQRALPGKAMTRRSTSRLLRESVASAFTPHCGVLAYWYSPACNKKCFFCEGRHFGGGKIPVGGGTFTLRGRQGASQGRRWGRQGGVNGGGSGRQRGRHRRQCFWGAAIFPRDKGVNVSHQGRQPPTRGVNGVKFLVVR
ncbi:hypothetical protein B0H16DRAFT_1837351 [Mycena metata]|uniref:Uncharacterized protein n=1 Tax=Mycena metata TaxID=1033252 RepID=A0AAD7IX91_9AGAR|nr:hypothetical protein B0H16DRAFT_1837351 [Mycena metata]